MRAVGFGTAHNWYQNALPGNAMETKQKGGASRPAAVPVAADGAGAEGGDRKMDQIRELMFGGMVRDFERRLKDLADRLDGEVVGMADDYHKRIAALEARLDPQIERLLAQVRQEAAARASAIDDIDTRFNQALRTQRGELDAVLQRHEDESVASETRARETLSQFEVRVGQSFQAIRDTLSGTHAQLQGEKVARDDLADLLAELSLRLRGTQESTGNG